MSSDSLKKNTGSYHHGDLRSSLIAAANAILEREGADGLSLRAIAAEVGVSHMAPYSHFKNKKELLLAVTEMGFERLAVAMTDAATASGGSRDLVLTYGAAYLGFAVDNPELYRLMLGQVETRGRQKRGDRPASKQPSPADAISSKRPYRLLKDAFATTTRDEQEVENQALGAWSLVHGLAALVIEKHVSLPCGTTLKEFLLAVTPQR